MNRKVRCMYRITDCNDRKDKGTVFETVDQRLYLVSSLPTGLINPKRG